MSERETITLADASQAYNFSVGTTYMWTRRGVRARKGWWAFEYAIRDKLVHWTRWFRPRLVCSQINHPRGEITMTLERWSWRRWRWEHR